MDKKEWRDFTPFTCSLKSNRPLSLSLFPPLLLSFYPQWGAISGPSPSTSTKMIPTRIQRKLTGDPRDPRRSEGVLGIPKDLVTVSLAAEPVRGPPNRRQVEAVQTRQFPITTGYGKWTIDRFRYSIHPSFRPSLLRLIPIVAPMEDPRYGIPEGCLPYPLRGTVSIDWLQATLRALRANDVNMRQGAIAVRCLGCTVVRSVTFVIAAESWLDQQQQSLVVYRKDDDDEIANQSIIAENGTVLHGRQLLFG